VKKAPGAALVSGNGKFVSSGTFVSMSILTRREPCLRHIIDADPYPLPPRLMSSCGLSLINSTRRRHSPEPRPPLPAGAGPGVRREKATMERSMNSERPNLGAIITGLHDSEINGEVAWFYDGIWRVKLGDADNAIAAEATVASAEEAAEWLRANAVRCYPHSEFARLYPRLANDP
jgi:hypothetical protein